MKYSGTASGPLNLKNCSGYLKSVDAPIFLSILGYEDELSRARGSLSGSAVMDRIHVLLEGVQGIHIDVIRPPYSERP
ncbi:MAG: hypothetical protein NWF12_08795, partial [Candidatus Bathyarchaeota archaeon]|nr:hypothetical protein [Candidatus Bathyarchaeota archaeon]